MDGCRVSLGSFITSSFLPFSDLSPSLSVLTPQVYRRLFEEQVITTLQEIGEVNEVADQLETGMWCEMDIGNSVLLHDLYSLKLNDLVRTSAYSYTYSPRVGLGLGFWKGLARAQ